MNDINIQLFTASAPLATFQTSINLYSGSKIMTVHAAWYMALPPIAPPDAAVVLSAPSSDIEAVSGLYISYKGVWQLVVPYLTLCDYTATGLQLNVYLDVSSVQPVAAGSLTFQMGATETATTIPAGKGVWAVVTLDAMARTRAVAAATGTTLGGIKSGGDVTVDANGTVTVKSAAQATQVNAGTVKLATPKQASEGTDNTTAMTPLDVKTVYAPLASPKLSGCTTITDPQAGAKLLLAMTVDGSYHTVAPKTLDQSSIYLQVGGSEYNANSYRLIGFGYNNSSAKNPPVAIGSVEMDSGGSTKADFIVATRSDVSVDPPKERLRVAADGRVTITNDQTKVQPTDQELVTKKYLDVATKSGGAKSGNNITVSDDGTVSVVPNPNFTGAATLANDQTANGYTVGNQDLVTKKYTEAIVAASFASMSPKFYEWSGLTAIIEPPFVSGSTWILTPALSLKNFIVVSSGKDLKVKTGDWFVLGNANFAAGFGFELDDNAFYRGTGFPPGYNFTVGPGESLKFFWSPNNYWIVMDV